MTTLNMPRSSPPPLPAGEANASALTALRPYAHDYKLRRRQALPQPASDCIDLVISGVVAVSAAPVAGEPAMIELLYSGDVITASLEPRAIRPECLAITQSHVRRYPLAKVVAEMARSTGVAELLFSQLNHQRDRMQMQVALRAILSNEQHVIALLLQTACRLGVRAGPAVSFDLPMSRIEAAGYLAINADSLSRIMARLERDEVLTRTGRSRIVIRDWEALKALCPAASAVIRLHAPP